MSAVKDAEVANVGDHACEGSTAPQLPGLVWSAWASQSAALGGKSRGGESGAKREAAGPLGGGVGGQVVQVGFGGKGWWVT